jgi:hypothetical protein
MTGPEKGRRQRAGKTGEFNGNPGFIQSGHLRF